MTETRPRPEDPEEEVFESDGAEIGHAFRISIAVILGMVLVVAAGWYFTRKGKEEIIVEEGPGMEARPEDRTATPPAVSFTDVTESAGITFVHENGASEEKFLPETMGGGAAFYDHDGDGDPDLLFVNGTRWDSDGTGASSRLYLNDGKGSFQDVTEAVGLDQVVFQGMGIAIGDYDNDGDPDLYFTGVGRRMLMENRDGRYVDITAAAGVGGKDEDWSTSAAFVDIDGDRDLDLFVCNYVRWSPMIDREINYQLTGVGRAYGPPTQYAGSNSYLFKNNGDGTFDDVSASAGIEVLNSATQNPMGKALGIAPIDIDGDHHIDLMVANDTVQNFLFHNRGDGTFEEISAQTGVGYSNDGAATGAMGIDTAYYRDDQALAIAIGNFANEMSSLYVQQGLGSLFSDEAISEGVGPTSRRMLSFGLFFFDYDLDGRPDLLQANGHLEEEINKVQPSQHYRQPPQLFWNAGRDSRRCFVPVEPTSTGAFNHDIVGRAATYADIDADGDLDVLFTQVGDRPLLLRNDQALGHHFLRLRLQGTHSNRDAIGAWVEVTAGGRRQRVQCMPSRSYLAQTEKVVTVGLGDVTQIDKVEVVWPDGSRQSVDDPTIDATTVVLQSE